MNITLFSPLTLLIIVIGFSTSVANAAVYKWKDKDGNVHFSQNPRDADSHDDAYELQYTPSKDDPQDATSNHSSADSKKLTPEEQIATMEKHKLEADKKSAEAAKKAAEKQEKCNKAKKRMAVVSRGGRLYEIDKDGNRSYWNDATIKSKQTEAQGFVDSLCN